MVREMRFANVHAGWLTACVLGQLACRRDGFFRGTGGSMTMDLKFAVEDLELCGVQALVATQASRANYGAGALVYRSAQLRPTLDQYASRMWWSKYRTGFRSVCGEPSINLPSVA
jgi:hypothetical protein